MLVKPLDSGNQGEHKIDRKINKDTEIGRKFQNNRQNKGGKLQHNRHSVNTRDRV